MKLSEPVIINLTLPDFLRPFFGPEGSGTYELHLGPRTRSEPVHLRVTMRSRSGIEAAHDRITCRVVQAGTHEVTLESAGDGDPWRFRLVLSRVQAPQLTYSAHYGGVNVRLAAHGAKFEQAMLEGGELRIYDADSGLPFASAVTAPNLGADEAAVREQWIRILDALSLIQAITGIPLRVPDGDLSQEEAERAFQLARILSEGRLDLHPGNARTTMTHLIPEAVRQILDDERSAGSSIMVHGEAPTVTLLGAAIPLGPGLVLADHYRVTAETKERLASFLAEGSETAVEVEFEPAEGAKAEIIYPKWAPEEVIRRLPPDVAARLRSTDATETGKEA